MKVLTILVVWAQYICKFSFFGMFIFQALILQPGNKRVFNDSGEDDGKSICLTWYRVLTELNDFRMDFKNQNNPLKVSPHAYVSKDR